MRSRNNMLDRLLEWTNIAQTMMLIKHKDNNSIYRVKRTLLCLQSTEEEVSVRISSKLHCFQRTCQIMDKLSWMEEVFTTATAQGTFTTIEVEVGVRVLKVVINILIKYNQEHRSWKNTIFSRDNNRDRQVHRQSMWKVNRMQSTLTITQFVILTTEISMVVFHQVD